MGGALGVLVGSAEHKKRCRHNWEYAEHHSIGAGAFIRGYRCTKCGKFKERRRGR